MHDIIIIGAGPAGMTAGLYAKQARKNVLIFEKETYGGQILKADNVKNYPGFESISGYEYSTNLYNQIKNEGVEIKFEEVISIKDNIDYKEVITTKNTYKAKAIIIAAGAKSRQLGLNNEDKLIGKGISYCTACDGMFFKDKTVAIYGGGNSAVDGAIYLSDICSKVYYIYRQKELKEESLNIDILKSKENIEFILNTNITNLNGNNKLESITIKDNTTKEEKDLTIDGLFIEIGYVPVSSMCNNIIDIDDKGYIISNEECTTKIDGIFVAGDIKQKTIRQLTTACSDGTIAALNACKYINKNTEK